MLYISIQKISHKYDFNHENNERDYEGVRLLE